MHIDAKSTVTTSATGHMVARAAAELRQDASGFAVLLASGPARFSSRASILLQSGRSMGVLAGKVDLFASKKFAVASAGRIVQRSHGYTTLTGTSGISLRSQRIGLHQRTNATTLSLDESVFALSAAAGLETIAWSTGVHSKSSFSSKSAGQSQVLAAASAYVNTRAHADLYSNEDVVVKSKNAGVAMDANTLNVRSMASVAASADADFDMQGASISVVAAELDQLFAGTVDVSTPTDVTIHSHAHLFTSMPLATFAGQKGISLSADAV